MQVLVVSTLFALFAVSHGSFFGGETVIGCENKKLQFWCRNQELIDVRNAVYGRTKPYSDVCPFKGHYKPNINCIRNVTEQVKEKCDGRPDCTIFVSNKLFGDPCFGTFKYLEILFYCLEDTDDCDPDPCENGGTCTDLGNDFKCDCRPGYEGKKCEINTDDCDPNPCKNGAICTDLVNDFKCECRPGYKGKRCQIGTCDGFSCPRGKKCVLVRGRPTCVKVFDPIKPGSCPCPTAVTATRCDIPCKKDRDCPGKQKCCENKDYVHVCSDPEH